MKFQTTLRGKGYLFETKGGLFSKNEVDPGTRMLIEKMEINPADTVLDMGCGYGPIGIVAASLAKSGKVYMVDVDIRAIKYSQINAELNMADNVEIFGSDGFEKLDGLQFDKIMSHPPTHASNEVLTDFIEGAKEHLKPQGVLYFVTEKRVKPFIRREFERVFGDYEEIASEKEWILSSARMLNSGGG